MENEIPDSMYYKGFLPDIMLYNIEITATTISICNRFPVAIPPAKPNNPSTQTMMHITATNQSIFLIMLIYF